MYISGQQNDFMTRLHQTPTGMNDMDQYKIEVSGYWPLLSPAEQNTLQKEAQMQIFRISGNNSNALLANYF